jgi:hypothetical protein
MDLNEAYNQIDSTVQKGSQKLFLGSDSLSLKQVVWLSIGSVLAIWYGYIVLMGSNSYSLVKELEKEKRELKREILELQEDNQKLQRDYFNLKVTTGGSSYE